MRETGSAAVVQQAHTALWWQRWGKIRRMNTRFAAV